MSAGINEKDRHMFPRWRSFKATSKLGELSRPTVEFDIDTAGLDISLAMAVSSWEGSRSLWTGLDLIGTAAVAGKLDSFSALIAEIENHPLAPAFAKSTLARASGPTAMQLDPPEFERTPGSSTRKEINTHRKNLIETPKDAIEWVELARAYTIAGENEKARRAIRAALQLAPNNRFVLRSAARFFIHAGEAELAHALLSSAAAASNDPWLLASEIAIADFMGRTSNLVRTAKQLTESGTLPSELTELASALGTLEAAHGNHRLARRFLRQAVINPNENSVAQIEWLNRNHLGAAIDTSEARPPLRHEADAWANFYKGEFEIAREESLRWLADQPFSSAPATLSSYIFSAIFWDFATAKEIAEAGLRSTPTDSFLLNNLAVCQLELGLIIEAEQTLSRVRPEARTERADPTFRATFGMLEFRKGNPLEGRRLYLEAIARARAIGSKSDALRATFHLVFEEIVSRSDQVQAAIDRLAATEGRDEMIEAQRNLQRIRTLLEGPSADEPPLRTRDGRP